jgi:cation diffusion facilitator family transporter
MPASSKRALLGAVAANLAVAATKFLVGSITQSTVMMAEGIHSLVDCGNSALMLYGGRRSRRPPDQEHPFGYGMEVYFWGFVVSMMIFGGGGGLSIYEGVRALMNPQPVTKLWPNFVVIGAAALFEGASLLVGAREFAAYRRERRLGGSILEAMRASKDPAMFVTVLEDAAALAGLAIAAVGLTLGHWLEMPAIDASASILIGLVLLLEAALLGVECRGLIVGEAARPLVIDGVRRVCARYDELGPLDELRTLQLGPNAVLLLLRFRPRPTMDVARLSDVTGSLEQELRRENASIKHIAFYLAPSDH